MNGYFQLVITDEGTGIKVFPPTEGSQALQTNDVRDYLDAHKIEHDVVIINDAVTKAEGNVVIFSKAQILPIRESYAISVSKDRMLVTAIFYPPTEGAQLIDEAEIVKELAYRKINTGIKNDNIKAFFANREYCKEIVLAEGEAVREGHDAKVEYHFTVNLHARPTLNEDGSVDYKHLNLITNVNEGDLLATLHPEDRGDPGKNVYGEFVKPHNVKTTFIKAGPNTVLAEDKMTLRAGASGHVTVKEGKISVSNVLTIQNVGVSTGNIDYEGSVEVVGNVAAGFSINAGGNVHVKGSVEGASINAGADVILERGINGMGRGEIVAGGNIVTKFIENAKVQASGSITSETIMHSTVTSGTEINVSGKKGFIAGGKVSATNRISAKVLGSEMGANTQIDVGADPTVKVRLKELQKSIALTQKNLESIQPTLESITAKVKQGAKLTPEQLKYAQQLVATNKQLNEKLMEDTENFVTLQEKLADTGKAEVVVEENAYPGTVVSIGELSMVVKKVVKYSKFIIRDGNVRLDSL
ncbi:MAG: FapA family protein [Butyrivibrio sp.]|nr:FapA family protein [Butyrivibrio sp.]